MLLSSSGRIFRRTVEVTALIGTTFTSVSWRRWWRLTTLLFQRLSTSIVAYTSGCGVDTHISLSSPPLSHSQLSLCWLISSRFTPILPSLPRVLSDTTPTSLPSLTSPLIRLCSFERAFPPKCRSARYSSFLPPFLCLGWFVAPTRLLFSVLLIISSRGSLFVFIHSSCTISLSTLCVKSPHQISISWCPRWSLSSIRWEFFIEMTIDQNRTRSSSFLFLLLSSSSNVQIICDAMDPIISLSLTGDPTYHFDDKDVENPKKALSFFFGVDAQRKVSFIVFFCPFLTSRRRPKHLSTTLRRFLN